MVKLLVGFITGILSSLYWTTLLSNLQIVALLLVGVLCAFATKLRWLTAIAIGMLWVNLNASQTLAWQLPEQLIGKTLDVVGQVDTLVTPAESLRFTLKVHEINGLNIRQQHVKFRVSYQQPAFITGQGQVLSMQLRLKPAHSLANDVGFHYQQWLISKGIRATGYQVNQRQPHLLNGDISWRQSLLNQLLDLNLSHKGWIAALTLGYRGLLEDHDWSLLQQTGVAHLVAISGLHLGIVASIAFLGTPLLVAPFCRTQRNLRLIAGCATIAISSLYAVLAGMSLPTSRALTMLLLVCLLMFYAKHLGLLRLIVCCCALVLFISPLSILTASFWLSFYAVALIGIILWKWPARVKSGFGWQRLLIATRLQLGLCLLMLPMVAWQFGFISLSSPLANLIAVPIVTLILVPLCLIALMLLPLLPAVSELFFQLADMLIELGIEGLIYLSQAIAAVSVPSPPIIVLLLFGLGLFSGWLPKFKWQGFACAVLIVPLFSYLLPVLSDRWQVDILDVGQGSAAIISRHQYSIVIDTGPAFNSGFNMADAIILPILQRTGLEAPDYIFITHHDMDHDGSLVPLLARYPNSKVMSNTNLCKQGHAVNWQGLTLDILWPPEKLEDTENNRSCVIKISDGNYSVLFAGDIERKSELALVSQLSDKLDSDILIAPHHGSKSSSSPAFIQAVSPRYAVFSSGYLNRWRFPRPEVVKRYHDNHIQTLNTAENGQIRFTIRHGELEVTTYRQHISPHWYTNN